MNIFRILAEAEAGVDDRAPACLFVSADTLFDAIALLPDGLRARSVTVRVDPQSKIREVACRRPDPAGPIAFLVDTSDFQLRRSSTHSGVGRRHGPLRKPPAAPQRAESAGPNSCADGR